MDIELNKSEKDNLVLILDVGSGSVGGSFIVLPKNKKDKIKVVYSVHFSIPVRDEISFPRYLNDTLKILEDVASRLASAHLGLPKETYCFLRAPWSFSQTRVVKMEKSKSFIFTSKLANDLIERETKLFENSQALKYPELGNKMSIMDKKAIEVALNGYKTKKPLNKKTKLLELVLFLSMTPENIKDVFQDKIRKYFNMKKIDFSSFLFSSFVTLRDLYPKHRDFILMDVGEEITEFVIIKNEIIEESVSFPLGKNNLIRALASKMDKTFKEAESLLVLYLDNKADDKIAKKIRKIINKNMEEWLKNIHSVLFSLEKKFHIPHTVFFVTDNILTTLFSTYIKNEQFGQYMLTAKKFNVIVLGKLHFYNEYESFNKANLDAALLIESIFINKSK